MNLEFLDDDQSDVVYLVPQTEWTLDELTELIAMGLKHKNSASQLIRLAKEILDLDVYFEGSLFILKDRYIKR